MDSWLILIIVIAGVLVLYLLFALIAYFLMKGAMNKAYDALVALIPYEKERLELVKKVADDLKNDHYRFSSQIDELIKENENVLEKKPVDVSKAKNQNDFLILYFSKLIKEKNFDKRFSKYQEHHKTLQSHLYLQSYNKNSPYYRYDKLAFRYNSYLNMLFLAPFVRRKYESAPIL